jgi:hypothetical protein
MELPVNDKSIMKCRGCGNCCFVDMIAYATDAADHLNSARCIRNPRLKNDFTEIDDIN